MASPLPPTAEPDRLARTLTQLPPPPLLQQQPQSDRDAPPMLVRPENAEEIKFQLATITLDGASVFPAAELAGFWESDIGQTITLEQLYEIADTLTRHYWSHGYILARVSVPAQTIENGKAQLTVREGHISSVNYTGPVNAVTDSAIRQIRSAGALNVHVLEQQLLLLNEMGSNNYRSVLSPAADNGVEITLLRETGPQMQMAVGFDNHGSRYVGPYLTTLSATLNDLPAAFHSTTLTLAAASQLDELGLIQLQHTFPLGRPDLNFSLRASLTSGEPGYHLTANNIRSRTEQLEARLEWDWLRQRDASVSLHAGLSVYNGNVDVAGAPLSADKLRTLDLGAQARWQSPGGASHAFSLTLVQGLGEFWGGSPNGSAKLSRADGHSDFLSLQASLSRLTPLGPLALLTTINAQHSSRGLLAAQEFSYGGASMGRAYDPSEISGDSGLSALAEFRAPVQTLGHNLSVQPFVFADYGAVWNRDGSAAGLTRAASAGLGARLTEASTGSAELILAQPLRTSEQSTYRNNGGPRLLFSLSAKF